MFGMFVVDCDVPCCISPLTLMGALTSLAAHFSRQSESESNEIFRVESTCSDLHSFTFTSASRRMRHRVVPHVRHALRPWMSSSGVMQHCIVGLSRTQHIAHPSVNT